MGYFPYIHDVSEDDVQGAFFWIVIVYLEYIVYEKLSQGIMYLLQRKNRGKSKGNNYHLISKDRYIFIAKISSGGIFLLVGVLLYHWVSEDLGFSLLIIPIFLIIGIVINFLRG